MSSRLPPRLAWILLFSLLGTLLVGAITFDRKAWPRMIGDEATYLMQAQSLAWDQDLEYEAHDYERFLEQWGFAPEGLILQSGNQGETISFGKPAVYSAAIAPFVRLAPLRGAAIGNAVYLCLAALLAAVALQRVVGATAPLWIAAFVFASVAFAHTFWAHADLFLMCLVAAALALVYGTAAGSDYSPALTAQRFSPAFAIAGVLLATVVLSRPLYLSLALPALLATRGRRRWPRLASFLLGALLVVGLSVATNLALRQSWTPYGGERMGFYSATGFPAVDFPAEDWSEALAERPGSGSWVEKGKFLYHFDARLFAYDAGYFLAGRNIGLLPYFLPGLLSLVAFSPRKGRWFLILAVALTASGFFYLRAFNFYGGGGSLANRYFLPMYPALWFLVARRRHWLWPLLAGLLATPFLLPLWTAPRAFPLADEGGYRYVSSAAREYLPYETSLSHLKPAGQEDVVHNGLWVKFLTPGVRHRDDTQRFLVSDGGSVEVLIGWTRPLSGLELVLQLPATQTPTVGGAITHRSPGSAGERQYLLSLERPTARHRMWWTFDDIYLYRLVIEDLEAEEGGVEFVLRPLEAPPPEEGGIDETAVIPANEGNRRADRPRDDPGSFRGA